MSSDPVFFLDDDNGAVGVLLGETIGRGAPNDATANDRYVVCRHGSIDGTGG
jgi:hypothetical protein